MAAVKGSKQYQMVVVPYRPFYKATIFCLCLGAVSILSWSTYRYGINQWQKTSVQTSEEIELLEKQLADGARKLNELRQEIATLKLGGQIDTKANEEVQATLETTQDQIADMKEEIRFYKSVMLPNVEAQGLRIERVDLKSAAEPNKYQLKLLLTQIVDKRDYVQGNVQIKILGMQDGNEKQLQLSELVSESSDSIRFRFRYFQNINSELKVPQGFKPHQVVVVAQSAGRNGQKLERSFDWQISGD